MPFFCPKWAKNVQKSRKKRIKSVKIKMDNGATHYPFLS